VPRRTLYLNERSWECVEKYRAELARAGSHLTISRTASFLIQMGYWSEVPDDVRAKIMRRA